MRPSLPPEPLSPRWSVLAERMRPHQALAPVVAGMGLVVAVTGLVTDGIHLALSWVALYVLGVALVPLTRLIRSTARAGLASDQKDQKDLEGQVDQEDQPDPAGNPGNAHAHADSGSDADADADAWIPQCGDEPAGEPPRPSSPVDRGWRLLDDPICPRCSTDHAILADYYCDHCDHEWTIEPGGPWPDLVIDPTAHVPAPARGADHRPPTRPPRRS